MDCNFLEAPCMQLLNSSAGADLVETAKVMAKLDEVGRDGLHAAGVAGSTWVNRFAKARCESMAATDIPQSPSQLEGLRTRLQDLEAGGLWPVLVHADGMEDGIGARFKKALELTSAALHMGFKAVALAIPPASGLLHPVWEHGAVWCHESPAQSLKPPEPDEMYPLRCWRFELQADFLAQSPEPEGRMLLWGAPASEATLPAVGSGSGDAPARRFGCFKFPEDVADSSAWNFHRANPPQPEVLARLFQSGRAFASPALVLPERREALCGHGGPPDHWHVAVHVRRGDVGDTSGYTPTTKGRLGGQSFGEWLCSLAAALGADAEGAKLAVHVHTEAKGQSRGDLRRLGLEGFGFAEGPEDDVEPVFHTRAQLKPAPTCGSVLEEAHVAVNDNPRDALLCMARADILVTSHSSLGWASAVLNEGLVLHPDGPAGKEALTHWDLRDQYLDWAENWFPTSAVKRQPEALAAAFRRSHGQR
uniref:Uncharacterized protein n=1 Tax=Alexandrium monilatum TaxID=311494 RepID=A0A7S4VSP7_9DINO